VGRLDEDGLSLGSLRRRLFDRAALCRVGTAKPRSAGDGAAISASLSSVLNELWGAFAPVVSSQSALTKSRMSALFVDPISDTAWNRPAKKITRESAHAFLMDVSREHYLERNHRYGDLSIVTTKDAADGVRFDRSPASYKSRSERPA
jgi:hypothetical protein